MADLFDNPMGLCGFEFVEFASPTPKTPKPQNPKTPNSLERILSIFINQWLIKPYSIIC